MEKIRREHYIKDGSKWVNDYTDFDAESVYKTLSEVLISRYICKASWYSRVSRTQLYNGYIRITVHYAKGHGKDVYTVKDR